MLTDDSGRLQQQTPANATSGIDSRQFARVLVDEVMMQEHSCGKKQLTAQVSASINLIS